MVNRFQQLIAEKLPADVVARLPTDLPQLKEVQSRLNGLSQAEVAAKLSTAISELDEAKVAEFNQAVSGYARSKGMRIPQGSGISATPETALMLAGLLRGGGGLTSLVPLLRDPRIAAVVIPVLKRMVKS